MNKPVASNQKPDPSNGITLSGTPGQQAEVPVVQNEVVSGSTPGRDPDRPKYRLDEELLTARPRVIPLFVIPGYKTHIVAYDPKNPGSVQQWIEHGWEEIMPANADPSQAVEENINRGYEMTGNRCALGGGLIGIPMKLPEKYYQLSMRKLEVLNDSMLANIDGRGSLKEEANDDEFYGTRETKGRGVKITRAR